MLYEIGKFISLVGAMFLLMFFVFLLVKCLLHGEIDLFSLIILIGLALLFGGALLQVLG